jgi:hypothetical protein
MASNLAIADSPLIVEQLCELWLLEADFRAHDDALPTLNARMPNNSKSGWAETASAILIPGNHSQQADT